MEILEKRSEENKNYNLEVFMDKPKMVDEVMAANTAAISNR